MSRRSKKKPKYQPVKQVTQADANRQLNNLMGTQLGFVGTVLDTLIPRAENWVDGRAGLQNFIKRTRTKRDDLQDSFGDHPAVGLLEGFQNLLGIDPSQQQGTNDTIAQMGLTPEQLQMAQRYMPQGQGQNYNFSSPFNINVDRQNNYKV